LRAIVVDALRADGHAVTEASNGEQLLFALLFEEGIDDSNRRFDVVLSDVKMPKLSGLGVLAALRSAHLHCPVVLMTVLADESVESVGKALGAVGVLRKPFRVRDLRSALANAVLAGAQLNNPRRLTQA
jgi:CheY-like chemotaxis protein